MLADADTGTGIVMGTAGYMSPEQVRGQAADQRSDIFSFGAVLYETLTGKRAFQGASPVETMNAILKESRLNYRKRIETSRRRSSALSVIVWKRSRGNDSNQHETWCLTWSHWRVCQARTPDDSDAAVRTKSKR